MDKPKERYRDDSRTEISFIDLNQPITIILASSSKFFLEGINRVIRNEKGLIIAWEVQNQEELEQSLDRIKPDILFIDNRAQKFDVTKILVLINPNTRLILLGDDSVGRPDLANVTYLTKHTSSSELIMAMRKVLCRSWAINIEEYRPNAISSLTHSNLDKPETIIELTEEVFSEDEDSIKLFDDEFSPGEEIDSIDHEFGDVYSGHNQENRMGGGRRLIDFRQFSLILLLLFGVIYFGAKYMYSAPELNLISDNPLPETDSETEPESKRVLSEEASRDASATVSEGPDIPTGKAAMEETQQKADDIAVTEVKKTEVKKVEHGLDGGKKATDTENPEEEEVVKYLLPNTEEEPEDGNARKISDQSPKNVGRKRDVAINRSAIEEEANESRRQQVLAELENEVKSKENIEIIRTNYEKPAGPGDDDRLRGLPSAGDVAIARDIQKALASEGYEHVKVSVKNGEVFLIGEVDTHLDHIRLHRIALKTSGVTKIKSVLGVAEYSSGPPNLPN